MGNIVIEGGSSSDPTALERKVRRLAESVDARVARSESNERAWQVSVPGLPDEDLREMWNEIDVDATDRMP